MVPRRFASVLVDHEVDHVVDLGWRAATDGQLLSLAEDAGFQMFITKDGNLPYQQNLTGRQIAVVVLKPLTQDVLELLALAPAVLSVLPDVKPGSVSKIVRA